jgi:hypothetical protein
MIQPNSLIMHTTKIILPIALLLSSCIGNEVLYYGKAYPATKDIDIFFQQSDITEPHEIVGKAIYEDSSDSNSAKIQEKIIAAMKMKGIDGIIFEDISLSTINPSTINIASSAPGINSDRIQVIKTTLVKYKKNMIN